jgi:hypothetical protein
VQRRQRQTDRQTLRFCDFERALGGASDVWKNYLIDGIQHSAYDTALYDTAVYDAAVYDAAVYDTAVYDTAEFLYY